MARVQVDKLRKTFGKVEAVRDISFEVDDGEFAVMLGPSGCGKTTTLRCIAGLERPDRGDILFDGERVNDLTPAQRNIAFVFQFYALYPHLTVRDNIAFPLRAEGLSREEIKRRVDEVLELLEIGDVADRKPRSLTADQRQRTALGRAIVRRPRVFLLDEPLSNLDAKLRERMRGELKRLQRSLGITAIYVTHDQIEAMSMADKIIVMNDGLIQQIGTPKEVYHDPANLFVANFIGSPGMNFIKCRYVREERKLIGDGNTFAIPISREVGEHLGGLSDTRVILGVRPESIELSPKAEGDCSLEVVVDLLEPMGSINIINLKVGDQMIKAISASDFKPKRGERLGISFKEICLFDAQTEQALVSMEGEKLWRR
ncbi:TPA: ABC transporter ATP-binding protein [Candidatus Poribacteria bacterium]|nr:ABC transporter ATP-binding protein [Candidatus Poribacteria bacterium]HEX29291.1 ABC transporter ATP-binding protein [Candidatus Poribacteria bacterium]